jgi:hypothetical protein
VISATEGAGPYADHATIAACGGEIARLQSTSTDGVYLCSIPGSARARPRKPTSGLSPALWSPQRKHRRGQARELRPSCLGPCPSRARLSVGQDSRLGQTLVGRTGIPFLHLQAAVERPAEAQCLGKRFVLAGTGEGAPLHGFARGGEQGLGVFAHGYDLELAVQGFEDLAGYFQFRGRRGLHGREEG